MPVWHVPAIMASMSSASSVRLRPQTPFSLVVRRTIQAHALGCKKARLRAALVVVAAATDDDTLPAIDEYPKRILSGEWPDNFSILSYTDLYAYLETQIVNSDTINSASRLMDVMSRPVQVATPGQRLAEIVAVFTTHYSGLPVVEDDSRCIGVVSNKDKAKATNGVE